MAGATAENTSNVVRLRTARKQPIDLVHLAMQTLGDAGLQSEVLRLYEEMVMTFFRRLTTSTTLGERVAALNGIAGASRGVGAFTLAELADKARREMDDAGDLPVERLTDIKVALTEVSGFVADMLSAEPT